MPILNIDALDSSQINALISIFKKFKEEELDRLPMQFDMSKTDDSFRFQLDNTLVRIISGQNLSLKILRPFYEEFLRSPIFNKRRISRNSK